MFNTKVEGHSIADLIYMEKITQHKSVPVKWPAKLSHFKKFLKVFNSTYVRGDQSLGWSDGFCSMTSQIHTLALAVTRCLTPRKTNSCVR